jgi:hypothetical protein
MRYSMMVMDVFQARSLDSYNRLMSYQKVNEPVVPIVVENPIDYVDEHFRYCSTSDSIGLAKRWTLNNHRSIATVHIQD